MIIIIIIINFYHLFAGCLLLYTWNNPCFYGIYFATILNFQMIVYVMLFSMLIVLYFYISTLRSMCAVPPVGVFSSSFISCFPGVLLRYFLIDCEKIHTYTISQQMDVDKYAQSHIVILQQHVSVMLWRISGCLVTRIQLIYKYNLYWLSI
jgi:hypothetical protein